MSVEATGAVAAENVRWRTAIPIALYALLALTFSGLLAAVQPHTGIDTATLSLVQFGPALAVPTTLLIIGTKRRQALRASLPAPVALRWVLAGLLSTLVAAAIIGATVAIALLLDDQPLFGPHPLGGAPFVVFALLQALGALGEETGWRGFMQPILESRFNRLVAVLITGTTWALWHVQAYTQGLVVALSFFTAAVLFAALLGYLANGTARQRILIATTGHWAINVALALAVGDDTAARPQVTYITIGAAAAILLVLIPWTATARPAPPTA